MRPERESPIFRELNTKKVGETPSSAIDLVSKDIHIQQSNSIDLQELDLINRVTFRDGLPIPNTGKVVQTTGDNDRIQFQPETGEVWQFVGGDILETGTGTFSVNFEFRDSDGNIALMCQSSSTGQEVIFDQNNLPLPVVFTNTLYLYANVTGGEGRISTAFVRLR